MTEEFEKWWRKTGQFLGPAASLVGGFATPMGKAVKEMAFAVFQACDKDNEDEIENRVGKEMASIRDDLKSKLNKAIDAVLVQSE